MHIALAAASGFVSPSLGGYFLAVMSMRCSTLRCTSNLQLSFATALVVSNLTLPAAQCRRVTVFSAFSESLVKKNLCEFLLQCPPTPTSLNVCSRAAVGEVGFCTHRFSGSMLH